MARALALVALGVAYAACVGCHPCSRISTELRSAMFDLSCTPSDLSSVRLTGVCARRDGATDPSRYLAGNQVLVFSEDAGLCHVELTFASGFTYSTDVEFTLSGGDCAPIIIAPTQSTFVVGNPSSSCLDGGVADGG